MNRNADELVEAYLKVRNARDVMRAECEQKEAEYREELSAIEALMLEVCDDIDANSIKTAHGTIMRRVKERFFCTDWDHFKDFVLEHQALDLFEKRIHQGNFKEFMAQHEDEGLPPGVNVMREYGITVRKAS